MSNEFLKKFEGSDQLGSLIGHRLNFINQDRCESTYKVDPKHFNPNGILHGGALFTAMDSSQGAFVHYILDTSKFKYAATGTATIKFLAPVREGTISIVTTLSSTENRKLMILSKAFDETLKEVANLNEIWVATLK